MKLRTRRTLSALTMVALGLAMAIPATSAQASTCPTITNHDGEMLQNSDWSNCNLYGISLQGTDLTGSLLTTAIIYSTPMSGAILKNVDLAYSDLFNSDLSNADLSNAAIWSADLESANLSGADLTGADLHESDLSNANLSGANLSGANLSDADLSGVNFTGVDLSTTNVSRATFGGGEIWTGATCADGTPLAAENSYHHAGSCVPLPVCPTEVSYEFEELGAVNWSFCQLGSISLHGTDMIGSDLSRATGHGIDFRSVRLELGNLSDSDFQGAILCGAVISQANLTGANFAGADDESYCLGPTGSAYFFGSNFTNANLTGANVTTANFMFTNLSGANLTGVILSGSTLRGATDSGTTDWTNTTCPDTTPSSASNVYHQAGTCIDHAAPNTFLDMGPVDGSTVATTDVTFNFSTDEGAVYLGEVPTFKCSFDGSAFTTCAGPQFHGGLEDGTHSFSVKAIDANGNADATPATTTWTVYTGPPCTITGTAGADILAGTKNADVICGLGGDDKINGKAGNDYLSGGSGNDSLIGGLGDDWYSGDLGVQDMALFNGATGPVNANLITNNAFGQGADVLEGMESLTGTGYGDTLTGYSDSNKLLGGAGNDILNDVLGGADQLSGQAGDDTINVADGINGNGDGALGQAGFDTCTTDPGDVRKSCEA